MNIQKLTWAGVLLESQNYRILIDAISGIADNTKKVFGEPKEPFTTFDHKQGMTAALFTHTHNDHFDPKALLAAYGEEIPVLVPAESIADAEKEGFKKTVGMQPGDKWEWGPFTVTAAFSSDGFGSPQVAWVVEAEGKKMIHAGDTLWHGRWWSIARTYGLFEAAFLPVNAALIELPGQKPSGQPISLSPEQAVSAASILNAKQLIPIHFNTFHQPPTYIETPDVLGRLTASAQAAGLNLNILDVAQWTNV